MTRVAVVSGLSGAGRSVAAGAFEDLGWFVIDNLPGALVSKVGELARSGTGGYERVALVMGGYDAEVSAEIELLRSQVLDVRSVFLEAATDVLLRRYKATKRRHPLERNGDLLEAIETERRSLAGAKAAADVVIDTSDLNPYQLRERIAGHFGDPDGETADLHLTVLSFGYKHGLPLDADVVLDCRFLPNPYWESELRALSGQDDEVRSYVLDRPPAKRFLDDVERLLEHLLPEYRAEGKSYLTIAFGCTGGRHRSVAIAEHLAAELDREGWQPRIRHRDLDR